MFCLFLSAPAQENEIEVKSKIDNVTVFLEGAQVSRRANVSLKPGVNILTFSSIAPQIQEQSIQVEAPSAVTILSVAFKVNYMQELKAPEKISALEEERRRLWASLAQEKSLEQVYREEETILKTNKSIGGTARGVSIEELKVAMDYFRQRLMDISQQLLSLDRNIRKYNESIGKIDAQLKELSSAQPQPSGEIIVKVSTKTANSSPIKIHYLVREARWYPSYDIRAKNIQSPISITYKASVSQNSGEDWKNVKLTISSGKPSQGGATPIMKPWVLGFNNVVAPSSNTIAAQDRQTAIAPSNNFVTGRIVDDSDNGMPGVNILIKGTTIGTVSDAAGYYSIPLTPDAQTLVFSFIGYATSEQPIDGRSSLDVQLVPDVAVLSEVVVTAYGVERKSHMTAAASTVRDLSGRMSGVQSEPRIKKTIISTPVVRQTNVEYTLDESFTVNSDGEVNTTAMVEYELDALYEYYCVPKLDADAFLTAKVLNWDEHNFLSGEANLFFEDKYIGKSILDTRHISDTLTLSLGRDGNVVVTREKKKDFTSRHVIGSNQKVLIGYEIAIRNKKAQQLSIVIEDQVPLANSKEISIDKIEDSQAEYDKETGLLKWRKQIDPGKTERINLQYAVRYPKYAKLILE